MPLRSLSLSPHGARLMEGMQGAGLLETRVPSITPGYLPLQEGLCSAAQQVWQDLRDIVRLPKYPSQAEQVHIDRPGQSAAFSALLRATSPSIQDQNTVYVSGG